MLQNEKGSREYMLAIKQFSNDPRQSEDGKRRYTVEDTNVQAMTLPFQSPMLYEEGYLS